MATAPTPSLPLFYNDLMPLNSRDHSSWKAGSSDTAPWLVGQHAIPLTVDEFQQAQRHFPIVFSSGENPLPLALMGLNEGVNVFVDDNGKVTEPVYIPAYIRRYPFMLAKLRPESDELSLCFDPTANTVGEDVEGDRLFNDDATASEATSQILNFCEQFEQAGQRTRAFMDELKKHDLIMEGEMSIAQSQAPDKPFIYRGFQMVNQEKLRELRGDQLRTWNQNGLLPLVHAHLFSMELMRDLFGKQQALGKIVQPAMPQLA